VLKGIDLTARNGEVVSILGSSGSGKSTLLRCINLLEEPEAGSLSVAGESVEFPCAGRKLLRGHAERLAVRAGMVFQSFNLWTHRSVLENVIECPVHVLKRPRAEAVAEAEALLGKVGLLDKRDAWPAQLSGGQQQRAAIARALAMRPQVLLLDEPTSALDPELVGEVLKVIADLAGEGRTMLIVTHEIGFARQISDRVVFLDGGQIAAQGSAAEMFGETAPARFRQFTKRAL
jgi:octopine/nopaline transport system ATP-binding protein